MDSLLASYASSDEEQEEQRQASGSTSKPAESSFSSSTSKLSYLFSSLPQPKDAGKTSVSRTSGGGNGEDDLGSSKRGAGRKSSSIFSSLPPPKQNPKSPIEDEADLDSSSYRENSSSISFSLPKPKSQISQMLTPVADPVPKRVIQFKLPLNPRPSNLDDEDEDEEDEDKERNKRRLIETSAQDSSVKSFLFKMPAPKNSSTLGVAPTSGSGRRSIIIETEALTSTPTESGFDQSVVNNQNYNDNVGNNVHYQAENSENYYANYGAYSGHDQSIGASVDASGYGGYDNSYGGSVGYGDQYGNNWGNPLETSALAEAVEAMDGAVKRGRRGKKEIAPVIVEVTQDQLMKNRPREDQVKSTGIAFGPAYQPASSKGKPTKLLKRKHQITSLYFDMKQKEGELSERRSRGFLTKSETQAKYGW